jgi:hypothetical protein
MQNLAETTQGAPARASHLSFAQASVGFVTSTVAVSALMVLLGSL